MTAIRSEKWSPASGRPLRGIVPPMITPLKDRDELDAAGLERLIEHILAGGVSGLFLLGSSGEAPGLSHRLRRELIDRACRQVAGRVSVLVGITDTSFVEAVALARHAADAGADALVASAPFYYPPSQLELQRYVEHMVPALPLPLFLYNMPSMTKVVFEPDTVRRALDHSRIVGLKDSSGDPGYFRQVLELARARPDWSVLMGPESLLADALLAGAHGGVSGGANVNPRLYVDLFDAAAAGDRRRAAELADRVRRFADALYSNGRHMTAVIQALKCAAAHLGLCGDAMTEPFQPFRDPERSDLIERLREAMAE